MIEALLLTSFHLPRQGNLLHLRQVQLQEVQGERSGAGGEIIAKTVGINAEKPVAFGTLYRTPRP